MVSNRRKLTENLKEYGHQLKMYQWMLNIYYYILLKIGSTAITIKLAMNIAANGDNFKRDKPK